MLAAQAGAAPSTCLMRVRRLQDTGVIRACPAVPAPEALGKPLQAIVPVRPQATWLHRATVRRAARRPERVLSAGVNDFQIHLAVQSPDDLRDFVVTNLSASREVAITKANLIFEDIVGMALA